MVQILDHTNTTVGSATVASDGSFGPIELRRTDRPTVWLQVVDSAGNTSPRVAVEHTEWVATYAGGFNPHRVARTRASGPHREPAAEYRLADDTSIASQLARWDGQTTRAESEPIWFEHVDSGVSSEGRAWAAAAYDPARGDTVLFGGLTPDGAETDDTWLWDGRVWREPPRIGTGPAPRQAAVMTYDRAEGAVLMYGGARGGAPLDDTWIFDGEVWRHRDVSTQPAARTGAAMSYDPLRRKSVLFGGTPAERRTVAFGDTWSWRDGRWSEVTGAGPAPRAFAGMAWCEALGGVVIFGGLDTERHPDVVQTFDDLWLFDGTSWLPLTPDGLRPAARWGATLVTEPSGCVDLAGGRDGDGALDDHWSFDGSAWRRRGDAPALVGAAAARHDTQRLVYGGEGARRTWIFEAGQWRDASAIGDRPSARLDHALAYDATRGVTVLFGGWTVDSETRADTWLFDGARWTQTATNSPAPPPRRAAAVAWDPVRERVVLHGGGGDSSVHLSDTWLWDGFRWTETATASQPRPRRRGGMAFDPSSGEMILFGGSDTRSAWPGTWAFDGASWRELDVTGPSPTPRERQRMVADPNRNGVVLFGGINMAGHHNDTWLFSNGQWSELVLDPRPSGRRAAAVAFDTSRGELLLFGGRGSDRRQVGDLWLLSDTGWIEVSGTGIAPQGRDLTLMAFDERRGETVLFGGFDGTYWPDTWRLQHDPEQRPSIQLTLSYGAPSGEVTRVGVELVAGGTGFTTTPGASGQVVHGARAELWHEHDARWYPIASNQSPASAPSLLHEEIATQVAGAIGTRGELRIRVVPIAGNGTGGEHATVDVDQAIVTVRSHAAP